jgi:hypothetical protein
MFDIEVMYSGVFVESFYRGTVSGWAKQFIAGSVLRGRTRVADKSPGESACPLSVGWPWIT